MASRTGSLSTLGRLAGEAVAIFLGVGAALAGQAWFEGRAQRVAEVEYLQAVLEEVAAVDQIGSGGIEFYEDPVRMPQVQTSSLAGPPDGYPA